MVKLELLHYEATPNKCCDGIFGLACSECDPFLQVCISNRCNVTSQENDKYSIDLTHSSITPHVFTELFNVSNKEIEIRIRAIDKDTIGGNDDIDEVHLNYGEPHSPNSNSITLRGNKLTITARITVDCIANFYGPQCTHYCQNTDHGKCDSSGNLTCQAGYFGQNCSLTKTTPAPTSTSKLLIAKSTPTTEYSRATSKSHRTIVPSTSTTQPKTVTSTSISVRTNITNPNIVFNELKMSSSTTVQTHKASTAEWNSKPTTVANILGPKTETTTMIPTIDSMTGSVSSIFTISSTVLVTSKNTTITTKQKQENTIETTTKSSNVSTPQPSTLRYLTIESRTGTSTKASTRINSFSFSRTEPTTLTLTEASKTKAHTSSTDDSTSKAQSSSTEAAESKAPTSSTEPSASKAHASSTEALTSKANSSSTEASTRKALSSSAYVLASTARSTETSTGKTLASSTESLTLKTHIPSTESATITSHTSSTEPSTIKSHALTSTTMPTSISSTALSNITKAYTTQLRTVTSTTMSTTTTKSSPKTEPMTVKFSTILTVPNITIPTNTHTLTTLTPTIILTNTFTPIQTMTNETSKVQFTTSSRADSTTEDNKTTPHTLTTSANQITTTASKLISTLKPTILASISILKYEPNSVTSTKSTTTIPTQISNTSTLATDITNVTSTTSLTTILLIIMHETTSAAHQKTILPAVTEQTITTHKQTSNRTVPKLIISTSAVTIASKPEQITETPMRASVTEPSSLTTTKYSITDTDNRSSTISTNKPITFYSVHSIIQPKPLLILTEHSHEPTMLTSTHFLTSESNKSHPTTSTNETATVKYTTYKTGSTIVTSTTSIQEQKTMTYEANNLHINKVSSKNTLTLNPVTQITTFMLNNKSAATLQSNPKTEVPTGNFTPKLKEERSTTIDTNDPTTVSSTPSSTTRPTLTTALPTKLMTHIFKTASRTERIALASTQSLNTNETFMMSTRSITRSNEPSAIISTTQPKLLASTTESTKTAPKDMSRTTRTTLTTEKLTMKPAPNSTNTQTPVSIINISTPMPTTVISSTSSTIEPPTMTYQTSKIHTTPSATEPTKIMSTSFSRNDLTTVESRQLPTETIKMTFRTISAIKSITVASSEAMTETLSFLSTRTQTARTFSSTAINEIITNATNATNKKPVISVTEPPRTSTLDSRTQSAIISLKPVSITLPRMTESTTATSARKASEITTSMSVKTLTNETSPVISATSLKAGLDTKLFTTGSSTSKYQTLSSTPTAQSSQAIASLLIKGDVTVRLDQVKNIIAQLISSNLTNKDLEALSISASAKVIFGTDGKKVTQIIYTVSYAGNSVTAEEILRKVTDFINNSQTLSSALATLDMQQYHGEITETMSDKNWIEEHVGIVAGVGSAVLLILAFSVVCIVRRNRSVHKDRAANCPQNGDASFASGNQELKCTISDYNGHIAKGASEPTYSTNV
ncbi:hypothetical protein ACJMK2_033546 [Sinanodonta woodiana]|uniref:EGF-like domain-containing protein n=1 Tax=Sinanodonta woodiana TaxID=1069815 RepID=A0ABD3WQU2_SINWO